MAELPRASQGLASIAKLFDAVAVLCYQTTCTGQRERWPVNLHSRLRIFDADIVNKALGFGYHTPHKTKVAAAFAYIANETLGKSALVRHVLTFEADWEEIGSSISSLSVAALLSGNTTWAFLRLGYNPRWEGSMGECQTACICRAVYDGICTTAHVEALEDQGRFCWVGSMVAFATHRRALPMVLEGPKTNDDAIDTWIPEHVSVIHYAVPGFVRQRSTKHRTPKQHQNDVARTDRHEEAMRGFARCCFVTVGSSFAPPPRGSCGGANHTHRPSPVLFVHAHKAGGTSMCALAHRNGEHLTSFQRRHGCSGPLHGDIWDGDESAADVSCMERTMALERNLGRFGAIERWLDSGPLCDGIAYVILLRNPRPPGVKHAVPPAGSQDGATSRFRDRGVSPWIPETE